MKNIIIKNVFVLFLLLVSIISCTKEDESIIIATASAGGTYYPVGVAIAALITDKLANDGIEMNAITSAGSDENIQLLKKEKADFAIIQGLLGSMAWQGVGEYEGKPETEIRSVTMLWENVEHFIIYSEYAKTGNISDLQNLDGEKFSIGKKGSGTEISGKTIIAAVGFNTNNFNFKHIGYTASSIALEEREVMGMNIPAGPPVSAITQAFTTIGSDKITLLEFSDEQLDTIKSKYPVWGRYVIPAKTYPDQNEDIKTISQPNILVATPKISDEIVYKILETIYSNLDYLQIMHKATEAIKLEKAISGLPIPLHSGAIKFYKDKGIEIPEHLIFKEK